MTVAEVTVAEVLEPSRDKSIVDIGAIAVTNTGSTRQNTMPNTQVKRRSAMDGSLCNKWFAKPRSRCRLSRARRSGSSSKHCSRVGSVAGPESRCLSWELNIQAELAGTQIA